MSHTIEQSEATGHAGLMDRMYRYQRHIYDVTRKYYLLGRDGTINRLNVPEGGSLLEVGCGTGRNLLHAAQRFPSARLYGLDISAEMLITARTTLRRIADPPHLAVADATTYLASDFRQQGFDRIMISYALSMIPDWERSIDASMEALNPGGSLHIIDFGQQERLPGWFSHGLKAWLRCFHVVPRANLRTALEARLAAYNATLEFESLYGGYAWCAVVTRNRPH